MDDQKYPEKEYKKVTFSFTPGELREIGSFDSIVKMGQLASVMLSNYISGNSLKRVGIRNSPDVGIIYDIGKGEFYVYEPRFWCSMCQNKKATFQYTGKNYCPTCMDVLKQENSKEAKEIKKEKKV